MHKRSIDYHFSTGLQSLNSLYGSSSRFFIINCLLLNQIITSEIIDNWIFARPQICVYRGWAPTSKVLETRTPKALNRMITVLMRHWKREFSVWHLWLIKKPLAIPYFIDVLITCMDIISWQVFLFWYRLFKSNSILQSEASYFTSLSQELLRHSLSVENQIVIDK